MTNKQYNGVRVISPKQLIGELEEICKDANRANHATEFPCFIEYSLKGRQVRLPLRVRYDDYKLGGKYNLGLFTAFTNEFGYDSRIVPEGDNSHYSNKSNTLFGDYERALKENEAYRDLFIEVLQTGDINCDAKSLRPARIVGEHLSKYRKGMKKGKFKNYK